MSFTVIITSILIALADGSIDNKALPETIPNFV